MNENASAIEVADAIFDCINENFINNNGNVYPKSVLLVLRNEIITTLK